MWATMIVSERWPVCCCALPNAAESCGSSTKARESEPMSRKFPPDCNTDVSMLTFDTFDTLFAASAYAPAIATVVSTTTMTNA